MVGPRDGTLLSGSFSFPVCRRVESAGSKGTLFAFDGSWVRRRVYYPRPEKFDVRFRQRGTLQRAKKEKKALTPQSTKNRMTEANRTAVWFWLPRKAMQMRSDKRAIDKIYKRRDRYEIPEWQRQEVWSRSKKQNLTDSILRGWKLPKFYFLKVSDDPETYEVVDGQQRLVTIFEFFDNELPLADQSAKEFKGTYYRGLPDNYVDVFDDYEIEFDEIEDATDEEVKLFFQRLQEGLPLTSSEKLNSIHSKLRDFVMKLPKHPVFTRIAASDRRYGHFDILAKAAAVEIDGIDVGLRYDDLRAVFESQAGFSAQSNVGKRLTAALDFVAKGFVENAALLRNRTIVQSLLTLVCRLIQSSKTVGQEKTVAEFFTNFLKE